MTVEIRIPKVGESITEVQIVEWLKSEGDTVEQDEILVTIDTDKASVEIPAPASGTLTRVLKGNGDRAEVGDVIGAIEEGDGRPRGKAGRKGAPEDEAAAEAPSREGTAREGTKERTPGRQPAARPEGAAERRRPEWAARPEPERKEAPQREGEERREEEVRVAERPRREEEAGAPAEEREQEERPRERGDAEPRVMPAARRLLEERGLAPGAVEGTGPGGRVLKEDVQRQVRREGGGVPERRDREEELVPMSPLRRRIAERLVAAQRTAALLTTFNEIDMAAVIALKKTHAERFQRRHQIKLGFMSFFVKAVVDGLRQVPQLNAEIREDQIAYRNYYDIGIAVGGGRGLVVPVLRNAERMSFAEIETAIADLARRALENRIDIEELQGGTFTITNGGVYGSLLSTPIVNPPQSGILGLHAITDRPVARDGQVVVRPMMYVALTYDHRLVDGREAVTFLRHIVEAVEEPSRLLLEI